jgi:hypothetical protein
MDTEIEWLKVRLEYIVPVLSVIILASVFGYFTFLAEVTMKAVVVEEEGTGTEQASAGILNALIYIIPAIIGGFFIALLFKYRKKVTLRAFFGSALFFATTFISFFFFNIILYVIQLRSYEMYFVSSYTSYFTPGNLQFIYISGISNIIIPLSLLIGIAVSYIISSKRILLNTKNYALLFLGGLMGAFLSVILPTWTVVFMLVGLSLYDIYSVRRGPIREIMEMTYGPESSTTPSPPREQQGASTADSAPAFTVAEPEVKSVTYQEIPETARQKKPAPAQNYEAIDEDLLTNMTYGTKHWDLGIGDLVFYSMLGSHSLIFGTQYISEFGIIAPIALFVATTIGIMAGFIITLKLLSRNAMLPGLPMSIFMGLGGFGIVLALLHLL